MFSKCTQAQGLIASAAIASHALMLEEREHLVAFQEQLCNLDVATASSDCDI